MCKSYLRDEMHIQVSVLKILPKALFVSFKNAFAKCKLKHVWISAKRCSAQLLNNLQNVLKGTLVEWYQYWMQWVVLPTHTEERTALGTDACL